jgi:hypothetical protein
MSDLEDEILKSGESAAGGSDDGSCDSQEEVKGDQN